jgi:predicted O-methyltransferase YrrM
MATFGTPDDFREVVYAFQRSRIILTAFELGVFTALGDDRRTSAEVAEIIRADARATDRLMNALVVCGLIEKNSGLFANADFAVRYLVKGKPDYLKGYGHSANMWHTWSQLTEAVRAGHTVRADKEHDSSWREKFLAAMHERASRQAPFVISKLDLAAVNSVLDIGGGSGAYSIAFAKAKNDLHTTVMDLAHMLPITKKYIETAGLADRITTLAGDYHTADLGTGYDMIFCSAILHINSAEENLQLVAKCAAALNPGGWLVVQDHVMDDDRTAPPAGVFFALNMIVATDRGDTYTEQEITDWMTQAGLGQVQRIETLNNALMIARKPD